MQTASIIFGSNWKIASIFIKLFTLSRWCHCGIIDREGDDVYVIDTTLASGGRRILLEEWKAHYSNYEIRELPIKDKVVGIDYARSRVGKDYDKLGILSFVIYKDYQREDKDFCSELVSDYLGIRFKPWSISPAWLFKLARVCKGWVI